MDSPNYRISEEFKHEMLLWGKDKRKIKVAFLSCMSAERNGASERWTLAFKNLTKL